MIETTFIELAQRIYDLPSGQLLHFKTARGNDTELYGVTRLDLFESDTILLSLYGSHNTSMFDASVDYDAGSIESWLRDVVEANCNDAVYFMDNAEVFPNPKKPRRGEPVEHDNLSRYCWERIGSLREELTGHIVALLRKHHLQTVIIPEEYEDRVGVAWVNMDEGAYEGLIKTVSLYEKGISLNVEDNDGNQTTLYSGFDIACDHVEWLVRIFDMLTELLEGGEWRVCSHCGKLMCEGYVNKMCEPIEYYCCDECLHQHYTPDEWEQLCQRPEGQQEDGNDFCCWTTWS